MQTMRMILFLSMSISTQALAQSVNLIHKLDSDTIIVSQDDDVKIQVHRLPNSLIDSKENTYVTQNPPLPETKVAINIHKISKD
jgi:hypothetical protein